MTDTKSLLPTEKIRVIDAAREIGLDVSDWSNYKGGARRAAMNPKYCYEWALMQPGKSVLLNLWHVQLNVREGQIVADLNARKHAKKLADRNAKDVWRRRAMRMDDALRAAFGLNAPVRVLVLDGQRRSSTSDQASKVERRKLDPEVWAVTSYDADTGHARVTRGVARGKLVVGHQTLDRLKTDLLALAGSVVDAIAVESAQSDITFLPRERWRAINDGTGGFAVRVGSLPSGVHIELWLDHFSGWPTPRLWAGLDAPSPVSLTRLLAVPPLDRLRKARLRKSGKDLTKGPVVQFRTPLGPDEFDVLVEERYGKHNYLGVYQTVPWPYSDASRPAVIRETAALLADIALGASATANRSGPPDERSGGWARPDARSETAAIRHVKKFLRKTGYSVRSRELEGCGYDLHATGEIDQLHVEVKGCGGPVPRFFLSRREMATAKADADWRLAVVTNASSKPSKPELLTYGAMVQGFHLEAIQWAGLVKDQRAGSPQVVTS